MTTSNLQEIFKGHKANVLKINLELDFNQTRAIVLGRCLNDERLNEAAREEIMASSKIHSHLEKGNGPHSRLIEAMAS